MSCLLGLPDELVRNDHSTTFQTNKIGGGVVWYTGNDSVISFNPTCSACGVALTLVVQLYCPLHLTAYHRVLYVFTCTSQSCWNQPHSWIVFRGQCLDNSSNSSDSAMQTGDVTTKTDGWGADAENWGTNADDWGTKDDDWGTKADDWGTKADDWGTKTDDWGTKADDWGTKADDWGTKADDWGTKADDWGTKADDWGTKADDWGTKAGDWGTQAENCETENDSYSANYKDDAEPIGSHTATVLTDKTGANSLSHQSGEGTVSGDQDLAVELPLHHMCLDEATEDEAPGAESAGSVVIAEDITQIDEEQTTFLQELTVGRSGQAADRPGAGLVSYYLNVFEEPERPDRDDHVKKLLREYTKKEGIDFQTLAEETLSGSSEGGAAGEKYERSLLKHGDIYFHKFMKRLSVCPEQCVRYEWNGTPLYMSKLPPLSQEDTRCRHCGGEIVYELQLMPALVNCLRFPGCDVPAVEFGTVIVFTCRQSCWEEGQIEPRSEKVIVQSDPDQHLFKK